MLTDRQREFFQFVIDCGVLRFGEFKLKSGRVSPYFFNAGLFNTGARLARLAEFYAPTIIEADIAFDMLFGPAYKGIPLATATATVLAQRYARDVPFAFNRKEAKDHGEGGNIVGSALSGRVLIVDDVVSAGISVGESLQLIKQARAQAVAVAIALDRQERGQGELSATQEIMRDYRLPVISIADMDALMAFLRDKNRGDELAAIETYRARYGV